MKNVPDSYVREVLGRAGDAPVPGNTRNRWGQRVLLGGDQPVSKTFVATKVFEAPLPWAVAFRFSLDGTTWTAAVPAGYTDFVQITVLKGIDEQSAPAQEFVELAAGQTQPFCSLIAQSLQVSVRIVPDSGPTVTPLWVECVATIVSNVDCADIIPPPTVIPSAILPSFTNRFPAVANVIYATGPDPTRALLTVVNRSTATLFLLLGPTINIGAGTEHFTIALPGSVNAGYEVLNYRGRYELVFDATDAAGYGLQTVGVY